jgi:hypothetical protein
MAAAAAEFGTQCASALPMAKRSKKLLKTKTKAFRRAFKKYPLGAAAALLALGGLATTFGGKTQLRRLKDGAMRRLLAARNAVQNEELAARH